MPQKIQFLYGFSSKFISFVTLQHNRGTKLEKNNEKPKGHLWFSLWGKGLENTKFGEVVLVYHYPLQIALRPSLRVNKVSLLLW